MDDSRLYHAIPKWLEKITKNRDWDKELTVLKSFLPTEGLVWEWSCRTGHLGALLGADVQWQGGETNPDYFQLAQQRHTSKVHQKDFPSVRVACLYSWYSPLFSISPQDLEQCLSKVIDAIEPSGWAVLEAGSNPAHARSRFSMMDVFETDEEKLVRAAVPILEGDVITFEYSWMVATQGVSSIEEAKEVQKYTLHSDETVIRLVQSLGAEIELVERDGIRLWIISNQLDVIDRLKSAL